MSFLLLSSGFFLGWSLGANDAGNIFGPAVSTKMLNLRLTAIIASVFIILGALLQGAGTVQTLSNLGSVNQIFGSFTVAFAAAISLFLMIKIKIPVSSSQSVVGAIIGWNLFAGTFTDVATLAKIVSTWLFTPILSALIAMGLFLIYKKSFKKKPISLFKFDFFTRIGFVFLVAFSAYSLGANNIAIVVGMFVDSAPFTPIAIFNRFIISPQFQLFFLGSLSIAIGFFTKSMKNEHTGGNAIFITGNENSPHIYGGGRGGVFLHSAFSKMSPINAFIAILASSLVLFLFSFRGLNILLNSIHLPTIPLVPVSSSQAIIGAIIGIGIVKGANNIQYKNFSKIALGWVINPIIACLICFFTLFFVQNVLDQSVYKPTSYVFNQKVFDKLHSINIDTRGLSTLNNKTFHNARALKSELNKLNHLKLKDKSIIAQNAEFYQMYVSTQSLVNIRLKNHFSDAVYSPLLQLEHQYFEHKWELVDRLSEISDLWAFKPNKVANDFYNTELEKRYELLYVMFSVGN